MNALALLLVLASAFLHALKNFFVKTSHDKTVFNWEYNCIGTLMLLPAFLFFFPETGISWFAMFLGAASGVIHAVYNILYTKAYEHGDLSHLYPIMRSSPALVLVFALLFLGETVSLLGVSGIVLVAIGVYTVNLRSASWRSALEPISLMKKSVGVRLAFLTLLAVTAYTLFDKFAVGYVHPVVFLFLLEMGNIFFLGLYVLFTRNVKRVKKEWERNKRNIVITGAVGVGGYFLILLAFTLENVSYVTGLRQISVVFGVLLGGWYLKESGQNFRLPAALLIFAGAVFISLA